MRKYLYFIIALVVYSVFLIVLNDFISNLLRRREPKVIQFPKPAWENIYTKSVKEFGPLKVGDYIPIGGPGDTTAYPRKVIPKSQFYVYVHRMDLPIFCSQEGCSYFDGSIVNCMGGWLSGDEQPDPASEVGLSSGEVWAGRESLVILADKSAKIIGIYPQHTEGDVVNILATYPQYRDEVIRCMKKGVALEDDEF